MAQRRMFSKAVVDSDSFMDMPLSAQAVYFHLALRADDDGFVGNPKSVLRMIGAEKEDFSLLIKAGFLRKFESGVVLVIHWKEHNHIKKDRYKPTVYQLEKAMVSEIFGESIGESIGESLGESLVTSADCESERLQSSSPLDTKCRQNGAKSEPQDSIGKDSIGKDSEDKESKAEDIHSEKGSQEESSSFGVCVSRQIFSLYNELCTNLSKALSLTTGRQKQTELLLSRFSLREIEDVFRKANSCPFLCGSGDSGWKATFDWLIKEENFLRVQEGAYDSYSKSTHEEPHLDASYDLDAFEKSSMFD